MALAFDVQIVGDALNTQGFEAFQTIEGLGLNSFGFLWPIDGIWSPCACEDDVVTTWVECDNC